MKEEGNPTRDQYLQLMILPEVQFFVPHTACVFLCNVKQCRIPTSLTLHPSKVVAGRARVRPLHHGPSVEAPSIIFIDEIDAIGRKRGKGGFTGGLRI